MPGLYFAGLVVSIFGMAVLDRRFRLFFWRDARRALIVYLAGLLLFVVWDLVGIGTGVFFRGGGDLLIGVMIAPELPVEELFFLTLLIYSAMNIFAGIGLMSRWERT